MAQHSTTAWCGFMQDAVVFGSPAVFLLIFFEDFLLIKFALQQFHDVQMHSMYSLSPPLLTPPPPYASVSHVHMILFVTH